MPGSHNRSTVRAPAPTNARSARPARRPEGKASMTQISRISTAGRAARARVNNTAWGEATKGCSAEPSAKANSSSPSGRSG
jgi:hypothetical protein